MILSELIAKLGFSVESKPLDAVTERLEGIQHRLEFLGAAEIIRGIGEMTEHFAHFAADLANAATTAGITTEALQGLQYAASQSGSSAEEVTGAVGKLSRVLYSAREGSQEAKDLFASVGISEGQLATFHSGSDALGALADKMAALDDPVKKQALAQKMLGGAGAGMIAFLSQGSAGMQELAGEAAKTGAILGGPNIEALQESEDAVSGLFQVIRTLTATFASYFAPAVKIAANLMRDFLGANRELIATSFFDWAKSAVGIFGLVFGVVEGLVRKFMRFAAAHQEIVSVGGKLLLTFMGLSIGTFVLTKGIGFASAIFGPFLKILRFAGMAIMGISWQVWAVIAAVAALILIGQAAWKMLHGGDFKDTWLGEMWDTVKGWSSQAIGFLSGKNEGAPAGGEAAGGAAAKMAGAAGAFDAVKAMALPPGAAAMPGSAEAPSTQETNFRLDAPITINVPPGTNPADVGAAAQAGVKEHLERVQREARRSLTSAVAY